MLIHFFPYYKIVIEDSDKIEICSSTGDPHYTTFDGK